MVFSANDVDKMGLSACLCKGLDEIVAYFKDKFDVNLEANLKYNTQSKLKMKFDTNSNIKQANFNAKNAKFDEDLIEIYENSSDLHFVYDGNTSFGNQQIFTCVKADAKIAAVSAASILAKVTHDRTIAIYDAIAPQYGLARNKGYASKAHIATIAQYGYQNFHRKSYKIKALEGRIFD